MSARSSDGLFLAKARTTASGKPYRGRLTCQDVQWTGDGEERLATFTITAGELTDFAESGLIWTDQDVQRGIKPEANSSARELSLADGYPDPSIYVFDAENADDIVDKLLSGKRLFLSPLIWNLRPGAFKAHADENEAAIYLYEGKVYLPDSHHRQQAIVKATRIWRDSPRDYPKFNDEKQFKVELYFLSREDEGNYFFDKNQRPRPTAKSKAYDLTTEDDLSVLAKRAIANSSALSGNVNRVTDRLTAKNPDLLTLSTLREMMRTYASSDFIEESELEGMAVVAGEFLDMLRAIRPEMGRLSRADRSQVRAQSVVDAAVMMHGYAALMRMYNLDLAKLGAQRAKSLWVKRLNRLSPNTKYKLGKWSGDFFDRANPLWLRSGLLKPSKNPQKLTVINTGATRSEAGRLLRQLLTLADTPKDISFLLEA